MGDRGDVLEELYVMWVEAQILQWVNEEGPEGSSDNSTGLTETASEEAREGVESVALAGRHIANSPVEGPAGEVPRDVAVNEQVASQLGDVAVNEQGVSQLGDVDGRPRFDPAQFWLMLLQAGYESW